MLRKSKKILKTGTILLLAIGISTLIFALSTGNINASTPGSITFIYPSYNGQSVYHPQGSLRAYTFSATANPNHEFLYFEWEIDYGAHSSGITYSNPGKTAYIGLSEGIHYLTVTAYFLGSGIESTTKTIWFRVRWNYFG